MSKRVWGPIIWNMLHCVTLKIKDKHFENQKDNIIFIITTICSNLPCPTCTQHASQILRNVNFNYVTKKQDLINLVFNLHNKVNKKTKKKEETKDILDKYRKMNFKSVLIKFFETFQGKSGSSRMMLHNMHTNMASKEMIKKLKPNLHKYNLD